ncbi:MAG: SGNH/GDSL hydrolase family protein [Gammaproteobacteria bacterium]|nr:SGNH/GDSL hydrolase family protein [Gammaproteobacteria bacterium]
MRTPARSLLRLAAAAVVAAAAGSATAATVWIFGDSLSDPGNLRAATAGRFPPPFEVAPDPPYPDGRRTNGDNWASYLDRDFRHATLRNAAVAGAIAGEFQYELAPSVFVPIDNLNDITVFGVQAAVGQAPALLPDVIGLQQQVARFSGTSSPADIGVFWIGANDFFASTLAPVLPTAAEVVDNIKDAARAVNAKGIETLVMGNLPDLGATPLARRSGLDALLSARTLQFNALLATAAQDLMTELPGFGVQIVDIHSAFDAVLADPAAYGLSNITDPCIPDGAQRVPPDPFPIPVTPTVPNCGDPNRYVFFDLVHPTTVLHREIANEFAPFLAAADVTLPGTLLLVAAGGLLLRVDRPG